MAWSSWCSGATTAETVAGDATTVETAAGDVTAADGDGMIEGAAGSTAETLYGNANGQGASVATTGGFATGLPEEVVDAEDPASRSDRFRFANRNRD